MNSVDELDGGLPGREVGALSQQSCTDIYPERRVFRNNLLVEVCGNAYIFDDLKG